MQALQLRADPAPFLTPFLRSFLLGVSFGAMFELFHVLSQVSDSLVTAGATVWSGIVRTDSLCDSCGATLWVPDLGLPAYVTSPPYA